MPNFSTIGAPQTWQISLVGICTRSICVFGGLERVLERIVELVEHLDHVFLGGRDVVELVFHVGGELQVEDLGEMLDQQVGDDHAQVGGEEAPLLLFDVAAVLDRLDDRGVGAGPADVLLLQGLDQRRLAVAGRRLGEVLGGVEARAGRAPGRRRGAARARLPACRRAARPGGGRRT